MSYRPFTEALGRHPPVKVAMHFSGILYDWFEAHEPAYLETLRGLSASGQVELVGGGYYEPILAVLPQEDQNGQIAKMQQYINTRFGVFPKDVWLAERVREAGGAGRDSLWKAQCNCGYWHGVFGGIYLPHIRKAIYADPVWGAVELSFSEPVLLWAFNLDTVSRSEEGIEKTYQGGVLAPGVKKVLEPGGTFEFTVKARPA